MKTPKKNNKYIVGIGASAGGLEAIHEFFDHMPVSSSFAFVIIQHLSSDYKSLLVELVSKHTHMKVFEAEDNMTIQQDCVYVIPNNKLMTVSGGQLKLSVRSEVKAPNTAIDIFYRSLAKDQKSNAIAIILSGTGTDGTKGIELIKECGGMVMVQEPASAKFDGMPNQAISSGNADHILLPREMPDQLFKFINEEPVQIFKNGKVDEDQLDEIFRLIYRENGHDFNLYKTPTIVRRITRRMNDKNVRDLKDYLAILNKEPEEVKLLGNDFLINVTRFFRDKGAFDVLESRIIPELISQKEDGSVLKVWVCACSTGEEAYSVAILLNRCVEISGKNIDIKIFATDVDSPSLEIAAANRFPLSVADDIPGDFLKKYFNREHKHYSIIPSIRKQIVFAKHDVIKSPPFIKNDLVTCRNMLIYMNPVLQQKILSTFHFSLNPDAFLFLGTSETGTILKEGFAEVSSKWKIYRKTGRINYSSLNTYPTDERTIARPTGRKTPAPDTGRFVEDDFKTFLMSELGFAGVYIDSLYVIREVVGNYRKFLTLPDGQIELNILKMVPKSVAVALNTAIRKSAKENRTIHLNGLKLGKSDPETLVSIAVRKPQTDGLSAYTLLAFSETMAEHYPIEEFRGIPEDSRHNEFVLELEAELSETRTNLQMAVEEMETTNEELQSSNEELLSANEELQSSNEELQSLNEELHTLNTEHQLKIKELVELNDDLDNYFKAIDVGFIFLTPDLMIRKFNPAVIEMVNLIDADIGRSFDHISNNILNERLDNEIQSVVKSGQTIQKEISLKNGIRCLMKIMPYIRKDQKQDGLILSFVDITVLTELSNIVTGVFNASTSGIFAFAAARNRARRIVDFNCISCNQAAVELLNSSREQMQNASMLQDVTELTQGDAFQNYVDIVNEGGEYKFELSIAEKWYQAVAVRMADGLVINLTDTTATKSAEQKLRKNYNELIDAREKLRTLNQELETRITDRTRELSESEERFKLVSSATNDTIWDWDLAANTLWRNENFTTMFGYKLDKDTSGVSFWFEKIHPDDRDRVKKSIYHSINKKVDNWSEQYRLLKQDETYAYVLDRGRILKDENGIPFRIVGSTIDITQLIESEKKQNELQKLIINQQDQFYSIFKDAPALITIRTGPELRYLFVNEAFRKFDGRSDYIGLTAEETDSVFLGTEIEEFSHEVFKTGKSKSGSAFKIIKATAANSRDTTWYDFTITPVYSDQGEIEGIAFFGFDVTDLVLGKQAVQHLMQQKDEFLSIASHELKTPITSIKLSLQIAERQILSGKLDAGLSQYLVKARKQGDKLQNLVTDLLDVTKIQAGKMQFNFSTFEISELVKESVANVADHNPSHKVRILNNQKVTLSADMNRIEQVVANFLSNAVKYSPDQNVIDVNTELRGNMYRFSVRDYGIGIPKDKQEQIFTRFYRVQESSVKFSGLGLGLYISAEIIRRHHGRIGVDSEADKGSTFWFEIPADRK